jgi:hypothetical protein
MKPRVQKKLDQIFNYPFFESVGKSLPSTVSSIKNWTQAAKSCGFVKWQNNKLMAGNALQEAIQKQYPKPGMWERMQEWNPLCEELYPHINSLLDTLSPKIPLKDKSLKNVKNSLSWDILAICMETEFNDIVDPIFYIPHLDPWYASGHFPCGWDGDEFLDDFETGEQAISFNDWDKLTTHGKFIVF